MKSKRKYKNDIAIKHLVLACEQYMQMIDAGVSENFAIRQLELFADTYSKILMHKSRTVHHVSRVKLWSFRALRWQKENPRVQAKSNLIVEHGTPRRAYARKVLDLHRTEKLNAVEMDKLVKKYWKLAVITLEEDLRLNKIKFRQYTSPRRRWAAAGIKLKEISDRK